MKETFGKRPQLSFVVPVFNGAQTIGSVVDQIHDAVGDIDYEIVLVNDGSRDDSEHVCLDLVSKYPDTVRFLQLARNFGEHHAVLAGVTAARGECVGILDDDGQNPPHELVRMHEYLCDQRLDVVYGCYLQRKHSLGRRLGSWINDRTAIWLLGKPPQLYLSSFKVMNRFVASQLAEYRGAYPYIDGLICRITDRIGQMEVQHCARLHGQSNYNLRRLVRLWLDMAVGFSVLPLRMATVLGLLVLATSSLLLLLIAIDKLWLNPQMTAGIPTVLASIVMFAGLQMMVLGVIGEYLGRLYLIANGKPLYVVRYQSDAERQKAWQQAS